MSNAIALSEVTKRYAIKGASAKTALDDVSLSIPQGSFFGLLGPNGAGKSTLINILAGLVRKTEGRVEIAGLDQDAEPTKSRMQLGIVPQEVVLDPFFTVAETLEHYAGYFGVRPKERITERLLKDMSLQDKANVNSRRLSGGMKRRVLIAKALVHQPPILVLDEPTAGVDVELRSQLWEYVSRLNKEGVTVLLTTHYLEEAEALCDRLAIINHGKIIANDSMQQMKQQFGAKQICVTLKRNATKAEIAQLEGAELQADGKTLLLPYHSGALAIQQLAALSDLPVEDICTQETDLETIFRQLVT